MPRLVAADWVVPVDAPPVADGAVVLEDDAIVAVGPRAALEARHPGAAVEAFPGCVIAPGFVNLHTHVEYSAYAGFGDGLPFGPWIPDHIARKRRLSAEDP